MLSKIFLFDQRCGFSSHLINVIFNTHQEQSTAIFSCAKYRFPLSLACRSRFCLRCSNRSINTIFIEFLVNTRPFFFPFMVQSLSVELIQFRRFLGVIRNPVSIILDNLRKHGWQDATSCCRSADQSSGLNGSTCAVSCRDEGCSSRNCSFPIALHENVYN